MSLKVVQILGKLVGEVSEEQAESSFLDIVSRIELCTLGTVGTDGQPHLNTCYFASLDDASFTIFTPPSTVHAQNVEVNSSVALAIFDSGQKFGGMKVGIQAAGTAHIAGPGELPRALESYSKRFPEMSSAAPDVEALLKNFESRLYVIELSEVKIFDEVRFGSEVWVLTDVVHS